jgi:hypothetical protein
MHVIEHTYQCLLADVGRLTGFSEIRGSCYTGDLQWVLNEAPKLEKLALQCIEGNVREDEYLDASPAWLRRLAAGALEDPVLLRYLRQLLLFCYKASIPHDKDTTDRTIHDFMDCNRSTEGFGNSLAKASPPLLRRARQHCQSVLYRFQPERNFRPSHGPGSSTTPKERWTKWYDTIESVFPYSDYMALAQSQGHMAEWGDVTDEHIEAELIAVPKDSRGPRLICVHPAESIWIQQGVRRELERVIGLARSSYGPWPKGHVHFDDQSVNGRIALLSSRSRRYATIDMKEASDRISEPLVQALFGRRYKWFGCCRAQKFVIKQPGSLCGQTGDIACYAPMGNATTFPVQSLVFWAICVSSLQRQRFHQPGAVFVFGDDIIIPTSCVEGVINDLETFGLLVNRSKSFWRGAFRESCGVDAYKGVNVTPVRWKTTVDAENLDGLQSLSDLAMRLRVAGYEEAASCCYANIRTRLARHGLELFLTNNLNHGGIAEWVRLGSLAWRDSYWSSALHWFHTPVWRVKTEQVKPAHSHWNGILESVCSLERTGHSSIPDRSLSRATRLKRGWTPVQ